MASIYWTTSLKFRVRGLKLSFYLNFIITKRCQHMVSDLDLYCLSMFNKENAKGFILDKIFMSIDENCTACDQ